MLIKLVTYLLFGNPEEKVQKVTDAVEKLYPLANKALERLTALHEEANHTSSTVTHIQFELAERRALVDALAESNGVNVDDVLASADLPVEPPDSDVERQSEAND